MHDDNHMLDEEIKNESIKNICDKLSERTAVLFLGAGTNANLLNKEKVAFPFTSAELSKLICENLLDSPGVSMTLEEAAEIARYKVGKVAFNEYLYKLFESFEPGEAHKAIVQLPWDVVYTTNYDLLIEKASKIVANPAGKIKSVFSRETDLSQFSEEDILYYKLHGSVDYANTQPKEGELVITKEDYRSYESYRKPLFRRLEKDLMNRTLVFVGYSLSDPNFRAILEDCREELGIKSFPRSYAIRTNVSEVEKTFWKEKYNIEFIKADSIDFLKDLKDTWTSEDYAVIPFEERQKKTYIQADDVTQFPKVGESYYLLVPSQCTGSSNPHNFFRGGEPLWADIRDNVPVKRDAFLSFFELLFPELVEPQQNPGLYLVSGHAGTGKSTLIQTLAYEIAHDFKLPVLIHIPGTPLDISSIGSIVDENDLKRIIILIPHAANYVEKLPDFIDEARRLSLPVTVILEERKNQWAVAIADSHQTIPIVEIELGALSIEEIENILEALEKYGELGKLSGAPRDIQIQHFQAVADKELLVALRELTTGGTFDDIIKDEFKNIPSALAQDAYVHVSALGQVGLSIRYETLIRIFDIPAQELAEKLFVPTQGVLISGEEFGSSRHNSGFSITTRHPIIASIIFAMMALDDDKKFEVLNNILSKLDPGYVDDNKLLHEIIRRRELVKTFSSPEKRRAVYNRLENILPNNPYVFQHRSLLEKELMNPGAALDYAMKAVKYGKEESTSFQNTYGLTLVFVAHYTKNDAHYRGLISKADQIFTEGITRSKTDPYNYIGKVNILELRAEKEKATEEKAILHAQGLSLLEEAYEITGESPIIGNELAKKKKILKKDFGNAETILNEGLKKSPNDNRLRDTLIRILVEQGQYEPALKIADEGVKYNSSSWQLQRHIAQLKRRLKAPIPAVRGYYEAAIRYNKGDHKLLIELAAYLFMNGLISEANILFGQAKVLTSVNSQIKNLISENWMDSEGKKRIFFGKVKNIKGAKATAIAIPENFEAFFWRVGPNASLVENQEIRFIVGFNAWGPVARIIL